MTTALFADIPDDGAGIGFDVCLGQIQPLGSIQAKISHERLRRKRICYSFAGVAGGNRCDSAPPATFRLSGAIAGQTHVDARLAATVPDSCHDTTDEGGEETDSSSDDR